MKFIANGVEKQNNVVLLLLFALFGLGLTAHVQNLSYFLLLIAALAALLNKSADDTSFYDLYRAYRPLHWAMASLLLALVLTQTCHGYIDLSPYNPLARLATFLPLLWTIRKLQIDKLRLLKWSWVAGAALCAIQIYFYPKFDDRPDIENWYVALASLLGIFSILSLALEDRPTVLSRLAHLGGGAGGLYVIYVCQTRDVWIALPLFVMAAYLTFVNNPFSVKKIVLFLSGVLLSGALFFSTDLVQRRVQQAEHDIRVYSINKNADTSIGTRFQLWEASWIMIKEHPLIGVGTGAHYKEAVREMVNRKILPTYYNGAHSHNEILFSTATMGIPGLIALLLTYLVPGHYFARHLLDPDRQVRAAAAIGFCTCIGFLIFGVADVLFKYKECEVFYCVACAAAFALMTNRKKQLAGLS